MLLENYTIRETKQINLGGTDKIKDLNKQIVESIDRKIERVEYELLSLSDVLISHGDLLEERDQF